MMVRPKVKILRCARRIRSVCSGLRTLHEEYFSIEMPIVADTPLNFSGLTEATSKANVEVFERDKVHSTQAGEQLV